MNKTIARVGFAAEKHAAGCGCPPRCPSADFVDRCHLCAFKPGARGYIGAIPPVQGACRSARTMAAHMHDDTGPVFQG
jgi:hypothetical protein